MSIFIHGSIGYIFYNILFKKVECRVRLEDPKTHSYSLSVRDLRTLHVDASSSSPSPLHEAPQQWRVANHGNLLQFAQNHFAISQTHPSINRTVIMGERKKEGMTRSENYQRGDRVTGGRTTEIG